MTKDIGMITSNSGKILLRMWLVNVPKGTRPFQKHCHTRFEIALVTSGSGIYTTTKNQLRMNPGDIFVFSSNETHCITKIYSDLTILTVQFEPRCLWGNSADSLSEAHSNICFAHNNKFTGRIEAEKSVLLKNIILKMNDEFLSAQSEYPLMIKTLLNRFLVLLIREYDYCDNDTVVSRAHLTGIRRVIEYIDSHFEEQLTLNELASLAGISPNYFSALFRNISSLTLWNYITSKRIEKATTYLSDEECNDTVLQIALKCGFNNTANFNKAFKNQTGMTPSDYRKASFQYDVTNI